MDNSLHTNKKMKVMIADDDLGILDSMKIMLEDEGYQVNTTTNGQDVKGLCDKLLELPDILLLDIWMSGMNGQDICKYLKSNKSTQHIPIIIISANKDTEAIAKQCKADGFLKKPFEMNELFKKINFFLNYEK